MTTPNNEIRPLVAGNWKMNGLTASLAEIAKLTKALPSSPGAGRADVLVAPPATLIASAVHAAREGALAIAGQDCHIRAKGAHTGDVSAEMLRDAGATFVIVGHSERRTDHGETDAVVKAKADSANAAGLVAIVCIGETAGERAAGLALDVVRRQILGSVSDKAMPASTVIAYEPVWAIGTGLTPTVADIAEMHLTIRTTLEKKLGASAGGMRILYGGSVKPDNARELMGVPNVNGALVGGASLKADDFLSIIAAYA